MPNNSNTNALKLNGRTVAVLRGHTLDVRRTSAGLLHTPPACALARDIANQAKALGCEKIALSVTDTGARYEIAFPDFMAKSWEIERAGFERQRVAVLSDWTPIGATSGGIPAVRSAPAFLARKPKDEQLSLFGGAA